MKFGCLKEGFFLQYLRIIGQTIYDCRAPHIFYRGIDHVLRGIVIGYWAKMMMINIMLPFKSFLRLMPVKLRVAKSQMLMVVF